MAERHVDVQINASSGEHVYEGFHIQTVNGHVSPVKIWTVRFNGVASNYLRSYLGSPRMIKRSGDRLTLCQIFSHANGE